MPEPGPSVGSDQPIYPAVGIETFFQNPTYDLTPGTPGPHQPLSAVIICAQPNVLYPLGDASAYVRSLQINFDQGFPGTTSTTTTTSTSTTTAGTGPTSSTSSTSTSTTTTTTLTTTTLALQAIIANAAGITVWIWSVAANNYVIQGTYPAGSAALNWTPTDDRLWSLGDFAVQAQVAGDGVRIIYS